MKKRLLSLVLCLVMVFSLLPFEGAAVKYETEWQQQAGPWTASSATAQTYYAYDAASNDYYQVYVHDIPGTPFYSEKTVLWKAGNSVSSMQSSYGGTLYAYDSATNGYYPVEGVNGNLYYNAGSSWKYQDCFHTEDARVLLPGEKNTFGNATDGLFFFDEGDWSIHKVYFNCRGQFNLKGVKFSSTVFYAGENGGTYNTESLYTSGLGNGTLTRIFNGEKQTGTSVTWDEDYWKPNIFDTDDYYNGPLYKYSSYGVRSLRYKVGNNYVPIGNESPIYNSEDYPLYNGTLYVVDTSGTAKGLFYKDANNVEHELGRVQRSNGTIYNGVLFTKKLTPLPPEPAAEGEMFTNKTLTRENGSADPGSYSVGLEVYSTGNQLEQHEETESVPLDVALVIDQSSSMSTGDMEDHYTEITDGRSWTVGSATERQYFVHVNGKYYPVYAEKGTIYTPVDHPVSVSTMFGYGHDGITVGVNGAPTFYNVPTDYYVEYEGSLHRLYVITAGLFLEYGLYPYIYTNNNDPYTTKDQWKDNHYWVAVFSPWGANKLRNNNVWNMLANGGSSGGEHIKFVNLQGQATGCTDNDGNNARLSYSWFSNSASMSNLYHAAETEYANQLYYINDAGQKVKLGATAQRENDVVYHNEQGNLWYADGLTRVEALQDAVQAFAKTLSVNGKDAGVTHRVAIAGFASSAVPQSFSDPAMKTAVNDTSYHYDYADTGLFLPNGNDATFKNYETVQQNNFVVHNGTRFINRHYYINDGGYVPVLYNTSGGYWYKVTDNQRVSDSVTFYDAQYNGLTDSDYLNAMMPVNESGTSNINPSVQAAINYFGCYGGTYTSYGLNMAEQVFNAPGYDDTYTDKQGNTQHRKKVIIVFTDGEPGANGYDASIAGEALFSGDMAKDNDVEIFTVGLFKGNPSDETAAFMKQLSSEYTMDRTKVYGGADNYGLGSGANALKADATYYYINESNNKAYALTAERGGKSSLGWWQYNTENGQLVSYTLVTPRSSTGAGGTTFYDKNGNTVQGDNVKTNTVYYNAAGDKIVYEYRWYDSERNIINPKTSDSDENGTQFYTLSNVAASTDGNSYYMTASNLSGLQSVFATITSSILDTTTSGVDQWNDDNTFVVDEISPDFDLPAITAENNHVKVESERITMDENGNVVFTGEKTVLAEVTPEQYAQDGNGVVVTWEGKKVTVKGFDFARNYVAADHDGQRLIITIDGLTPNKVGDKNNNWALYSNTSQAGVYTAKTENDVTTTELLKPFNRPSVPVPGYNVTWVDFDGSELDAKQDLLPGAAVVYDGIVPSRESDANYHYNFKGFEANGNQYLAQFDEAGNLTGFAPAFPDMGSAKVTYTAIYDQIEIKKYNVTWMMPNGFVMNGKQQLELDENVVSGTMPEYNGELPAINANDEYSYFFAGWHKGESVGPFTSVEDVQNAVNALEPVEGNVTYYAVFGKKVIPTKDYVVDYGVKHVLDTGVSGFDVINQPGGEFGLDEGSFSFTPKMNALGKYQTFAYTRTREFKVMDLTGMSKVNTAVYTKSDNYTKVNVVAASSIYLDDSVTDVSATPYYDTSVNSFKALNDQEYKAVLAAVGKAADDTAKVDSAQPVAFTFTGTGIEIYSKTAGNSGSLSVYLLDKEGKRFNVEGQKQGVRDISSENTTLYNVPVVKFYDLPSDTYTVVIMPAASGDFQLDGVRVFNANPDQKSKFLNVREALLAANPLVDGEEALFDGAFYLIGKDPTNSVAEYKKSGPKHEVYLDNGESVAFIVPAGSNYRIGLSAVDGTPVKVKFSNDENVEGPTVSNAIHMFYDIEPYTAADGSKMVMIKNVSGGILSVTDLQYDAATFGMFKVSRSLMNYVQSFDERTVVEPETVQPPEETTVPESPAPTSTPDQPDTPSDPTPTPGIGSWISQLFSNFVSSLFNSIARLFGGH